MSAPPPSVVIDAGALDRAALDVGSRWAEALCERLRGEGRTVDGGWPGTVPEARVLVTSYVETAVVSRGGGKLSADEIASLTNTAYQEAKRAWRNAQSPRGARNARSRDESR